MNRFLNLRLPVGFSISVWSDFFLLQWLRGDTEKERKKFSMYLGPDMKLLSGTHSFYLHNPQKKKTNYK